MSLAAAVCCCLFSTQVWAQTGVDDDRVSLPEGPGSLEGVGENIEIDPNMGSMSYAVSINTPGVTSALLERLSRCYPRASKTTRGESRRKERAFERVRIDGRVALFYRRDR